VAVVDRLEVVDIGDDYADRLAGDLCEMLELLNPVGGGAAAQAQSVDRRERRARRSAWRGRSRGVHA